MREINIYFDASSWLSEQPNATIHGKITEKTPSYLQIEDENGMTQIIMLDKLFAVVF